MREKILDTIEDLCSNFVYYDRKEDEGLSINQLNEALNKGEITVDEMVDKFRKCLEGTFKSEPTKDIDIFVGKDQLVHMVMGVTPNYGIFDNPLVKKCGKYNGSYGTWSWNSSELLELTTKQLVELYELCVNSYK